MTREERIEMIHQMRIELVLRGLSCTIFTEKRETRQGLRLFYIVQHENGGYLFQGSLTELREFIKDYNREQMEAKYGDFGDSVSDYIDNLGNKFSNEEIDDEEIENDLKELEEISKDEETVEVQENKEETIVEEVRKGGIKMYIFKYVELINKKLEELGYEISMRRAGFGSGYIEADLKKEGKTNFIFHFYKNKKFVCLKWCGTDSEEEEIFKTIENAF